MRNTGQGKERRLPCDGSIATKSASEGDPWDPGACSWVPVVVTRAHSCLGCITVNDWIVRNEADVRLKTGRLQ